ncbi:MAG TPA: adenylate/guanylate cyclase domain-containing protein [Stellaceae bacterium]|nr:adenylate/guanylate cyclase domain-containing protein [Stellaceae bacterium]
MAEERVVRRLAAILAADVAGYSRLMGADEEGTHERLKAHLGELVNPKITEHRGRAVKHTGDGLLAEFGSVVDAVRCAVEIQRGMLGRERDASNERRIAFRIGINLGDVIVEPHDIFGDGVNVAARLEALAEPGGVCVSQVVRDQVRDKLDVAFDDMGEQKVKNIARPVHVYRIPIAAPEAPAEKAPLSLPKTPSIAVLPFQNMSGDPEQDYFADGMVEEIITVLSRIRWLFVIARNSSFTYKGQAVDVKRVGRELGARYVLEGSVRKSAGRVRITAQLIEAETGAHLWADRFDGSPEEGFDLQDHVATAVAGAVEPVLQASEDRRRHAVFSVGKPPADRTAAAEGLATGLGAADPAVMTILQRRLAGHVGPIAKVLVDSAARKAQSVERLCELLAEKIDSPEERRDFLRAARRECGAYAAAMQTRPPPSAEGSGPAPLAGAASASLQTAIPPTAVELAVVELARVVGPIARVLVRRALPSCTTAPELWAKLADHIEQPAERAAFMRRQPR